MLAMKKLFPVAILLFAVSLCSCYKKHTCTCVKIDGRYNPDTLKYAIPRMKDKLAVADCRAKATYYYAVTYSCKLD